MSFLLSLKLKENYIGQKRCSFIGLYDVLSTTLTDIIRVDFLAFYFLDKQIFSASCSQHAVVENNMWSLFMFW